MDNDIPSGENNDNNDNNDKAEISLKRAHMVGI
jgi:hypothetical protein